MTESSTKQSATFLVDGMLGSLARKLRILGYDTLYDPESSDKALLKIAKETNRNLITADIDLFLSAKRTKIETTLVSSRTERKRLIEVLSKIGATEIDNSLAPRCSICNGELKNTDRESFGRPVYTCETCGKDYWRGSHWKKLAKLFHEVDVELRTMHEMQYLGREEFEL